MRTRTGLIATAATLAIAAIAVPLATANPDNKDRLVIGIDVDFHGSHATGTFAACCAINDHGNAAADILSFKPTADDQATFQATNTFTGQNGTIKILLNGVTGPLSSQVHIAHARWTVISGTGAYTNLRADGRLTAVTDDTNGSLAAIATGEGE